VAQIEALRGTRKWSASRIAFELRQRGVVISRRTVSRHLVAIALNRRRFIDPTGQAFLIAAPSASLPAGPATAPRRHQEGRTHPRWPRLARTRQGQRSGQGCRRDDQSRNPRWLRLLAHAVDGFSRLAYTEALPDEKAVTAIGFMHRARAWLAAHGIIHIQRIVTDNGACYRAKDFAHNGKVERYHRILAEEFCYAPHLDLRNPTGRSTQGLEHPLQLPPTTLCQAGQPPASRLATGVTNLMASYS
jgi:transposase InsO family protein